MGGLVARIFVWLATRGLRHLVVVLAAALVGMAIGSLIGYVAEALGAESIGYWMWGKWPFDPHATDTGSFWWLVGGGIAGTAAGCAYRLIRSEVPK